MRASRIVAGALLLVCLAGCNRGSGLEARGRAREACYAYGRALTMGAGSQAQVASQTTAYGYAQEAVADDPSYDAFSGLIELDLADMTTLSKIAAGHPKAPAIARLEQQIESRKADIAAECLSVGAALQKVALPSTSAG